MGCGSSAKPTNPDGGTTAAAPIENGKADGKLRSSFKSNSQENVTQKRRPSFSPEVEGSVQLHEGHKLGEAKDEKDGSGGKALKRASAVMVNMELWWMDAIPELFGDAVVSGDKLPERINEEAQAAKIRECVAEPSKATEILKNWLGDCPNTEALEKLIKRTSEDLKGLLSPNQKGGVSFSSESGASEDGPKKPPLQRKGTGFVTMGQVRNHMMGSYSDSEEEDEEEEDEEAEEEFEKQVSSKLSRSRTRNAITSEKHTVPDDWKPPVFEKTETQHKRIAEAVSESFMFAALNTDQLKTVIDAFQEVRVDTGVTVISEGAEVGPDDRGLYVLESGEMEVFKSGSDEAVFTYNEMGQFFGDLALLYNAPRAATVISKKPTVLWSIDRNTFNVLVKDEIKKAKDRRLQFLRSVELLNTLNADEKAKIGDALRERCYGTGVNIIQEGTEGDVFFILEKGSCAAVKEGVRVKEYKASDYFGELALLKNAPRAADIVTLEDCTVLSLDRKAFNRLLGPLESIMEERAAGYNSSA